MYIRPRVGRQKRERCDSREFLWGNQIKVAGLRDRALGRPVSRAIGQGDSDEGLPFEKTTVNLFVNNILRRT